MYNEYVKVVLIVTLVSFLVLSAVLEQESTPNFVGRIAPNRVALAQEGGKVVNVKDFGAKGDGVSDSTAAIQAAINAATNGTTVRFPSGTYSVSNLW